MTKSRLQATRSSHSFFSMSVKISQINNDQTNELRNIIEVTFLETFAHLNTAEDIEIYSAKAFTTEQIVKEFHNENSFFFFVYFEEAIAGYLKLNIGDAQTESKLENALEIERIYVLARYQGKRLGKALFEFSKQFASEKNAQWLWLGVWNQNEKAIEFYKRQGLSEFSTHDFMLGNDPQTDILMQLKL